MYVGVFYCNNTVIISTYNILFWLLQNFRSKNNKILYWLGGLLSRRYYLSDFKYIGKCLREENLFNHFDVKYEGEYFNAYKSSNIFFLFSLYPKGKIPKRKLKNALRMLYGVNPVSSPISDTLAPIFIADLLAYSPKIGDSKVIALPYSKKLENIVINYRSGT